jgi:hypothetical protein
MSIQKNTHQEDVSLMVEFPKIRVYSIHKNPLFQIIQFGYANLQMTEMNSPKSNNQVDITQIEGYELT